MKRCKDCRILHAKTNFYKHSGIKDGLNSYCKPCTLERQRQWRVGKGLIVRPRGPDRATVAKMRSGLGMLALSAEPTPVALWPRPV